MPVSFTKQRREPSLTSDRKSWNPRWFVAIESDAEGWRIEAAIPLSELTGDVITVGRTWCCNVVRVLPGRGVQAFSTPADVVPRPEGMGLLVFTQDRQNGTKPEPAVRKAAPTSAGEGGR